MSPPLMNAIVAIPNLTVTALVQQKGILDLRPSTPFGPAVEPVLAVSVRRILVDLPFLA